MLSWETCMLGVVALLGAVVVIALFFAPHSAPGLTGPRGIPWLGMYPELMSNIKRLHDWRLNIARQYHDSKGGFAFFYKFAVPLLRQDNHAMTVTQPDNIEYMLKKNFKNYVKTPELGKLRELLGDGIFNVNGEQWRKQRKSASHMFSMRALRDGMFPEFVSCADKLLAIVARNEKKQVQFDVQSLFFRATMDAICHIAFGENVGCLDQAGDQAPQFVRAFDAATAHMVNGRIVPWWKLLRLLQTKEERQFKEDIRFVDALAYKMIEHRKQQQDDDNERQFDLVSQFLKDAARRGEVLSDKFLRDIITNFILAGRDTTACLLSWTIVELCRNPHVEQQVLEELAKVTPGQEPVEYHAMGQLEFLEAVLFETLRLHPPVPEDVKVAVKDDVMPTGLKVEAGTQVSFSPYSVGRLESLWGEDAAEFRPSRWLESDDSTMTTTRVSQYKFVMFNAGPRLCLGKHVALLEAKVILSSLLPRFRLHLDPDKEITYAITITMPVKNGVWVTAEPRSTPPPTRSTNHADVPVPCQPPVVAGCA